MTPPRSTARICAAAPSFIFASPPPRKSNTTVNRPSVSMPLLPAQPNSDGLLGRSRSSTKISGFPDRALSNGAGFARLAAEVGLGHVGIVLGLEVSRLARNNADWYRLLDLCGLTDTLIGDADGIYHPAMFNDRLLLGLKGTMSEAELVQRS